MFQALFHGPGDKMTSIGKVSWLLEAYVVMRREAINKENVISAIKMWRQKNGLESDQQVGEMIWDRVIGKDPLWWWRLKWNLNGLNDDKEWASHIPRVLLMDQRIYTLYVTFGRNSLVLIWQCIWDRSRHTLHSLFWENWTFWFLIKTVS